HQFGAFDAFDAPSRNQEILSPSVAVLEDRIFAVQVDLDAGIVRSPLPRLRHAPPADDLPQRVRIPRQIEAAADSCHGDNRCASGICQDTLHFRQACRSYESVRIAGRADGTPIADLEHDQGPGQVQATGLSPNASTGKTTMTRTLALSGGRLRAVQQTREGHA